MTDITYPRQSWRDLDKSAGADSLRSQVLRRRGLRGMDSCSFRGSLAPTRPGHRSPACGDAEGARMSLVRPNDTDGREIFTPCGLGTRWCLDLKDLVEGDPAKGAVGHEPQLYGLLPETDLLRHRSAKAHHIRIERRRHCFEPHRDGHENEDAQGAILEDSTEPSREAQGNRKKCQDPKKQCHHLRVPVLLEFPHRDPKTIHTLGGRGHRGGSRVPFPAGNRIRDKSGMGHDDLVRVRHGLVSIDQQGRMNLATGIQTQLCRERCRG